MKNLIPVAAVVVLAMMFTSCKKEYTCTCTTSITGTPSTSFSGKTDKMSKKDAKAECEKGNTSTTVAGITTAVNCKID